MKKFLLSHTFLAIVICFMVTGGAKALANETAVIHQVIDVFLPVYQDATEESSVIGYVTQGDFVTTEHTQADWAYIHTNKLTGYVLSSGITKAEPTKFLVEKKRALIYLHIQVAMRKKMAHYLIRVLSTYMAQHQVGGLMCNMGSKSAIWQLMP